MLPLVSLWQSPKNCQGSSMFDADNLRRRCAPGCNRVGRHHIDQRNASNPQEFPSLRAPLNRFGWTAEGGQGQANCLDARMRRQSGSETQAITRPPAANPLGPARPDASTKHKHHRNAPKTANRSPTQTSLGPKSWAVHKTSPVRLPYSVSR